MASIHLIAAIAGVFKRRPEDGLDREMLLNVAVFRLNNVQQKLMFSSGIWYFFFRGSTIQSFVPSGQRSSFYVCMQSWYFHVYLQTAHVAAKELLAYVFFMYLSWLHRFRLRGPNTLEFLNIFGLKSPTTCRLLGFGRYSSISPETDLCQDIPGLYFYLFINHA